MFITVDLNPKLFSFEERVHYVDTSTDTLQKFLPIMIDKGVTLLGIRVCKAELLDHKYYHNMPVNNLKGE